MKPIKLILFSVLIIVCITFVGENYIYYLGNFTGDFYCTEIELKSETSLKKFAKDIEIEAKNHNVEVFAISDETKSLTESELTIFGTTGVKEYLKSNYQIEDGRQLSIFSGQYMVKNKTFNQFNSKDIKKFYIIGSKEEAYDCMSSLEYGTTLPKKKNGTDTSKLQVLGIWILVLGVSIIFSIYDLMHSKKEYRLRVFFGENNIAIIVKNILIDSISYLTIYLVVKKSIGFFSKTDFHSNISNACIIGLILLNALIYLMLIKTNVKKDLSGVGISKKILSMNYVFKIFSIIMIFIIISSNLITIKLGVNMYKQQKDFEEYQNHSYINLASKKSVSANLTFEKIVKNTESLNFEFYKEYFEKNQGVGLWGFDTNETNLLGMIADEKKDYVIANKNAKSYLQSKIKGLDIEKERAPIIYLLPKGVKSGDIKEIQEWFCFQDSNISRYPYKVFHYSDSSGITVVNGNDEELPSYYLYNVPIAIINTDAIFRDDKLEEPLKWWGYNRSTMYNFTKSELAIIERETMEAGAKLEVTNVFDYYEYRWKSAQKGMYISIILTLTAVFLEIMIIRSILLLEYRVNRKEFLIRKILGYNKLENYLRVILNSNISTIIGVVSALITFSILARSQLIYVIALSIALIIFENILVFYYISKMERINIHKILKGGQI